jgi:hypothetical protein
MGPLYDQIGSGYARLRRPDPRLAARIVQALDAAATVVHVGAGVGSYEPGDHPVMAVEPALTMIRQRPRGSAPVVRASATHLPCKDAACAAALAVLTVHHGPDRVRGRCELARVARDRVVVVTRDPAFPAFGSWTTMSRRSARRIGASARPSRSASAPSGPSTCAHCRSPVTVRTASWGHTGAAPRS